MDLFPSAFIYFKPCIFKADSRKFAERVFLHIDRGESGAQLFYRNPKVTLKHAALVTGPIRWGTTQLRAGELGFVANIAADGQLFKVEYTDPE